MPEFPYQDPSLSSGERAADLLKRLPLERKAGLFFHTMVRTGDLDTANGILTERSARQQLEMGMNHFNISGHYNTVEEYVNFVNQIQEIALSLPFGIPVTLSSDPRHAYADAFGLSMQADVMSKWPEHIGFVALRDEKRMEEYADIVRQEYTAIGLRMALHPQVDLATEYTWSRIAGGLGEDAELAGRLAAAHVRGLQGKGSGPDSVFACIKHFPGCGPAKNGFDPHFFWGSDLIYPGNQFDYHLEPFKVAFKDKPRTLMPAYGRPIGTKYEEISMAFNKGVITDLLRDEMGYEGTVVSDWNILTNLDESKVGDFWKRRAWGLEDLTREELVIKSFEAGVDQFGGEDCVEVIIDLVKSGRLSEERLDKSAMKILVDKFDLGLFEKAYADLEEAKRVVGRKDFVEAGRRAQKDSVTLVLNKKSPGSSGKATLPLAKGIKVYVEGFKEAIPSEFATTVNNISEADVAILRLKTPWETYGSGFLTDHFHHGSLVFPDETLNKIKSISAKIPVIVDICVDRPPVLGSIVDDASAITINYGIAGDLLAEVYFGEHSPKGKLPFDLPESMEAVKAAKTDTAFDTENPVFQHGFGLEY